MRLAIPNALVALALFSASPAAVGQGAPPDATVPLVVTLALAPDGTPAPAWADAIRDDYRADTLVAVLRGGHPLTPEEAGWADLIRARIPAWTAMTDSLHLPFGDAPTPDTAYFVLGNVGGQDAFAYTDTTVGFDLGRLYAVYGPAMTDENRARMDRLFAHEYTHLLHHAWQRTHEVALVTPFDRALWRCLVEGLGNYRSLSARWVGPDGALTPHAAEVLARLEPVFVERLAALAHATDEEAPALLAGLSSGPFDQKWGALPVALWLAQEAHGDDRRLRPWVEAGPRGVLALAARYLPEALSEGLPPR